MRSAIRRNTFNGTMIGTAAVLCLAGVAMVKPDAVLSGPIPLIDALLVLAGGLLTVSIGAKVGEGKNVRTVKNILVAAMAGIAMLRLYMPA